MLMHEFSNLPTTSCNFSHSILITLFNTIYPHYLIRTSKHEITSIRAASNNVRGIDHGKTEWEKERQPFNFPMKMTNTKQPWT